MSNSKENLNISQTNRGKIGLEYCPICKNFMVFKYSTMFIDGLVIVFECPYCNKRIEWVIRNDGTINFSVLG